MSKFLKINNTRFTLLHLPFYKTFDLKMYKGINKIVLAYF